MPISGMVDKVNNGINWICVEMIDVRELLFILPPLFFSSTPGF